jgi:long-subunit fatty acid transport protein
MTSFFAKVFRISLLLLATNLYCLAQEEDARLWLQASVEKKIIPKVSVELVFGLRRAENYSRTESYYTQLGFEYKLFKFLHAGVIYRHSDKREYKPNFHHRDRGGAWVQFRKKIYKGLSVDYRIFYQRQYTDMNRSEKGFIPSNYIRNKIKLQLDRKKRYKPYVSTELFYQIKYNKSEFNRVRFSAGVAYELNKYHQVTPSYMIQKEINEPNPVTSYVIGLDYKYSF